MSNHHVHPSVARRLQLVQTYVAQGYTFSEAVQLAWAVRV